MTHPDREVLPRREPLAMPPSVTRVAPTRPAPLGAGQDRSPRRGRGRRPNATADALFVAVDAASREPLYEQIYRGIRDAIRDGRLAPATRIPSTRVLAADLAVSRSTILLAIEQLAAEGFLTTHARSGTRVARVLPDRLLTAPTAPRRAASSTPADRAIGVGGQRALASEDRFPRLGAAPRPFRPGTPALDHFPSELWMRLAMRRYRRLPLALLDQGDPAGYAPLRSAIAAHVQAARGVHCTPEQIIVTAGAQQALAVATQVLVAPGDAVWMEDPGYLSMRGLLTLAAAQVIPVPVDADGIDVDAGIRLAPRARLAYVTPSHQYPLGVTMTRARRAALLAWAVDTGAWIIEDDYDNECRFVSQPLPALHALDAAQRVLYVGTFSKTVFPSLRIGYLIVPPDLVRAVIQTRVLADGSPPSVDQAILADFLAEGHFGRHVRRMRALYAERQQRLVCAVHHELRGLATVQPAQAGLHLLAWLPAGISDDAVAHALAARGVEAPPLSRYYVNPAPGRRGALLLGYGALDDIALRDGIRALRDVLTEFHAAPDITRGAGGRGVPQAGPSAMRRVSA